MMLPEVPVKVMVGAIDATLAIAASVMVRGLPGTRLSVAGVAVTPVGSPDTETATLPLKEFSEFASTEICAPDAPLTIVADAGVTLSEKSGAGRGGADCLFTPPHEMTAMQHSRHATMAVDRSGERLMPQWTFQTTK